MLFGTAPKLSGVDSFPIFINSKAILKAGLSTHLPRHSFLMTTLVGTITLNTLYRNRESDSECLAGFEVA